MDRIKDTVESLLKNLQVRVQKESPEEIIEKVFSAKELEHIRFGSLSKGFLRIAVDSSTWMYYFNLHKKALAEQVRARCPEVKELVFFIGEVRPRGKKEAAG